MTIEKLLISVFIIALISTIIKRWRVPHTHLFVFFLQVFLGGFFIFSGVVKAIDPLGTAYKMHDYFTSFAGDGFPDFWYGMERFDVTLAVSMIVLEIWLGLSLILGWMPRIVTWGMLAINIFFLYLTGYSYLSGYCITKIGILVPLGILILLLLAAWIPSHKKRAQATLLITLMMVAFLIYAKASGSWSACDFDPNKMKVTDCGCFGDFMKLKPWVTFYKDILLTILSLILVVWYHKVDQIFADNRLASTISIAGFMIALFFCWYNFVWTLPIVDFRPYAVGQDIKKNMIDPVPPKSDFVFVMKHKVSGEQKQFGMNEYPTDTIWEYVDRIEKVIQEGVLAPIKNLRIQDSSNADMTQALLSDPNTSYWIVCWEPKKTNLEAWKEKIVPFAQKMKKEGKAVYAFLPYTDASLSQVIGSHMPIYIVDQTALKTMIRSNPGIIELKNGVVTHKSHWRQFKP